MTLGMMKTMLFESLGFVAFRNHISGTFKLREEGAAVGHSPTPSEQRDEPSDHISRLLIKGTVRELHPRVKTCTGGGAELC